MINNISYFSLFCPIIPHFRPKIVKNPLNDPKLDQKWKNKNVIPTNLLPCCTTKGKNHWIKWNKLFNINNIYFWPRLSTPYLIEHRYCKLKQFSLILNIPMKIFPENPPDDQPTNFPTSSPSHCVYEFIFTYFEPSIDWKQIDMHDL